MTIRKKIVIIGLCYLSVIWSLIEPSSKIFMSLIPVILTSYYWVYEDKSSYEVNKFMKNILFISVSICLVLLLALDFTTTVSNDGTINNYIVTFKDTIIYIGGKSYSYLPFALTLLILYALISVFDIINHCLCNTIKVKTDNVTFAQMARKD